LAGTLPLEPFYQHSFVLDIFQDGLSRTISLDCLQAAIHLTSASWVTTIMGVSHRHLACITILNKQKCLFSKCPLRFHVVLSAGRIWTGQGELLLEEWTSKRWQASSRGDECPHRQRGSNKRKLERY
jgi:hypothetical protein